MALGALVLFAIGCGSATPNMETPGGSDAGMSDGVGFEGDGGVLEETGDAVTQDTADATAQDAGDAVAHGDADAATSEDSGFDAGADGAVAAPPSGWTPCGSGTFTKQDSVDTCQNYLSGPKDCTAVVIGGGSWQAWCDPKKMGLYVWAKMTGTCPTDLAVRGTRPLWLEFVPYRLFKRAWLAKTSHVLPEDFTMSAKTPLGKQLESFRLDLLRPFESSSTVRSMKLLGMSHCRTGKTVAD